MKNFRGFIFQITFVNGLLWIYFHHLFIFLIFPQNNRVAKQLSVGIHMQGGKHTNLVRCCALSQYDAQKISRDAFALIQNCNTAAGQQATW